MNTPFNICNTSSIHLDYNSLFMTWLDCSCTVTWMEVCTLGNELFHSFRDDQMTKKNRFRLFVQWWEKCGNEELHVLLCWNGISTCHYIYTSAVSYTEAQGFRALQLCESFIWLYNRDGVSDHVHSVLASTQQITLHQMGMPVTLGIYMCYYYGLDSLGQMS